MTDKMEVIRALLAKAEGTTFPDEAKALIEKAAELMAKYQIDEAMLRNARPDQGAPTHKIILLHKPYAQAKRQLFTAVASHNDCKVVGDGQGVKGKEGMSVYLFGFADSIADTEELFAILEIQLVRELMVAVTEKPDWEHGKTFSNNFVYGFASEINTRLKAAKARARAAGQDTHGSGMALVLVDQADRVNQAVRDTLGRTVATSSRRRVSVAGTRAGQAAGTRAALDGQVSGKSYGNFLTR